jgi:hypothetical protein
MAEYRYLVYTLVSNELVDEVRFTTFSYNKVLNRDDGWSATMPVNDEKATKEIFAPGLRSVWVMRDNQIIFGGILWTVTWSGSQLQLGGNGFLSYYAGTKRTVQSATGMAYPTTPAPPLGSYTEIAWTVKDQFQVVSDLFAHARSIAGTADGGFNTASGYVRYRGGAAGTLGYLSGVNITQQIFTYERRSIAELLIELSSASNFPSGIIGGFDFLARYEWSSATPAKPLRYLELFYPSAGGLAGLLEEGKNTTIDTYTNDATKLANQIAVGGSGSGDGKLYGYATDGSRLYPVGDYAYMEAVVSLSGQGIDENLSAQAFSELAFRARSIETMQVTVEDATDSRLGQINAGDTVRVKSNQGYMTIADVYRVVTVEVAINDLGIARQKFSLASVGASTGRL